MLGKDKIEEITDRWLNEDIGQPTPNDKQYQPAAGDDLYKLVNSVKLSASVSELCDELREPILTEINRRIDNSQRKKLWINISIAAASVMLLFASSNSYSYQKGFNVQNSQPVEMVNPLGMRSSIILPDSTKVILNAGTTLKYPTSFTGKNREVIVDGEAFFEVKPNAQKPFIVKADDLEVQVTGTSFNVKAYADEDKVEVTLATGYVKIKLDDNDLMYVSPNQQVVFDKYNRTVSKRAVNLNHYTSWKDGRFYFYQRSLDKIARQLERSFNVNIQIASEDLKSIVFTGDFIRGEGIEQVLRIMAADKRLKCTFDGDYIVIDKLK